MSYMDPVNPPSPVGGRPTRIQQGTVVTVNTNGTLDVKPDAGRAVKIGVPGIAGYAPAIGDVVLYCDLDGDPMRPAIVEVLVGDVGGAGGPLTGSAGGVLAGNYPNPTFAEDMATQAELDAHATLTTGAHGGIVAGNDARLTDQRVPTDGSVTNAKVAAAAAIAESKLALASDAAAGIASRRTLGAGALQAAAGNDARLTDQRVPTGSAGGELGGTYPDPIIADLAVDYLNITSIQDAAQFPLDGSGLLFPADGSGIEFTSQQPPAGLALVADGFGGAVWDNPTELAGTAGGVLAGNYPNPTFAEDMATQAELDAATAANQQYVDATVQGLLPPLYTTATLPVSASEGAIAYWNPTGQSIVYLVRFTGTVWYVMGGVPILASGVPSTVVAGTGWRRPTPTTVSLTLPLYGAWTLEAQVDMAVTTVQAYVGIGIIKDDAANTADPGALIGTVGNAAANFRAQPRIAPIRYTITSGTKGIDLTSFSATSAALSFARAMLAATPVYVYGEA